MKGIAVKLVAVAVVLSGLAIGWTMRLQQIIPQTCPFDPNLSVGLAFKGAHFYFHTSEIQDTVLNARFAWFQPDEAPNSTLFNARIAQEPPEEDWVWWETRFPTALLVKISDSLNRLGKAEVWDLDREILDGVLEATSDGSTINGSLILNEPASFRLVNVKDKNDKVLARLLVQNPKVVLHVAIVYASWIPHPPPREGAKVEAIKEETHSHPVDIWDRTTGELKTENWDCTVKSFRVECCPSCVTMKEQHIASKGTEVRMLTPPPQGCSVLDTRKQGCGAWVEITRGQVPPISFQMTMRYRNDSKVELDNILPPHDYCLRHVIHRMDIDSKMLKYLDETARVLIQKEILDFQKEEKVKIDDKEIVLDKSSALAPAKVKPYSDNCIHWGFSVAGEIRAVYVFPEIIGEKPEFSLIRTLLDWL